MGVVACMVVGFPFCYLIFGSCAGLGGAFGSHFVVDVEVVGFYYN
jgi:hypothetical protein